MTKLQIEYVNVTDLIPYINNPRKNQNAIDKVAASIKEFGFKVPIVVDDENVIIAGHTRILSAKKLGLKEVPVIRANDLTEQQKKAFRIADNKTGEFAEWDFELLEIEMEGIEMDMTQFGFEYFSPDDGLEDFEDFEDVAGREPRTCPHCGGLL